MQSDSDNNGGKEKSGSPRESPARDRKAKSSSPKPWRSGAQGSPTGSPREGDGQSRLSRDQQVVKAAGLRINVQRIESEPEAQSEEEETEEQKAIREALKIEKRQMDEILLKADARKLKDALLDMVDRIVVRQNSENYKLNFEHFASETSSRKVLKELLSEFHVTTEDLKKKINSNEEKIRNNKTNIERILTTVRKLTTQVEQVNSFNKRLLAMETKIDH